MVRSSSFHAVVAVLAARATAQDASYFMTQYMWHADSVPSSATCGVNCTGLCGGGMHDGIKRYPYSGMENGVLFANSEQYCTEACVAHSIETTMSGYSGWSSGLNGQKQGMYLEKVMAEYCSRGLCKNGESLQQHEAKIHQHDQREGENWGYPQKASGWPSTCETHSYYCTQFCQNSYHEPTKPMGVHPGADDNWKKNRRQCETNCNRNWSDVKKVFDAQCGCIQTHGAPAYPPHFLQESQEVEEVDVGAFIQLPQEL